MIAHVWHMQTWTNQLCVEMFTADIILASGRLWDLYSLSKLISRNNGLTEFLLPFPFTTVINKACSKTGATTVTLLLSLPLGLLNTACTVYAKVCVSTCLLIISSFQNVWCRRPAVWEEEVDPLLWGCDGHHLLRGPQRLRPGAGRGRGDGEFLHPADSQTHMLAGALCSCTAGTPVSVYQNRDGSQK